MVQRDRVSLFQSPLSLLLRSLAPLALLAALLVGCGDDGDEPVRLAVKPVRLELVKGRMGTAAATNNGDPAGTAVSWASANPAIASVTEAPDGSAVITGAGVGETQVTATLRDGTASLTVVVSDAVIESIAVTPPTPSLAAGTSAALTATATLSDMSTRNVTTQVTWTSSDTTKATVNASGAVRGVAKGTATVRATLSGMSATAAVTVTDAILASIQVTPTNPSIAKGLTQQMVATGTFTDGTTQNLTAMATWTSGTTTVATVNSSGLVTAVNPGTSTITATVMGISGNTTATVTAAALQSIAITPPTPSVAKGLTIQLTATGTYTDGSTADLSDTATWSSSNTAVASTNGRVITGVTTGNATITATVGSISGTAALTVTAAVLQQIDVTPVSQSLPVGRTLQYTATGIYSDMTNQNLTTQVTWTSSDTTKAQISNADGSRGLATAIAVTTAPINISATLAGVTGTTQLSVTAAVIETVTVNPASFSLVAGTTQQLTASAHYSDGNDVDVTTQVTWTSSNTARATVSNAMGSNGLVTSLTTGSVTITATLDGVSGTSAGTITAAALTSITVAPATATIVASTTRQFTATGHYSDSSTQDLTAAVTWTSSDTAVAQISNADGSRGLATGIAAGTNITITATSGSISGTATLDVMALVLETVTVTSAASGDLPVGRTRQMIATGHYNSGVDVDLTTQATWTTSAAARAVVSNVDGTRGVVTALGAGAVTITATFDGVAGSADLNVVPPVIDAIAVTPADATLVTGQTLQYTAIATLSDGSTSNVTATATWTSSNTNVATIDAAGLATGVGNGAATISATQGGVTGAVTLTVKTLTSIAIASVGDLSRGTSKQLVATGTFSDSTTADVTALATWTSDNTAAITVSDAAGSKGLATGVAVATATITATIGSVNGTVSIAGCTMVVNEVQVAGSAAGNEWIEIASKCTSTQNLAGLRLVYRSATGTTDVFLTDLTGTLAAGGYAFWVHVSAVAGYPTANGSFGTGTSGNLSGTAGGVALRIGSAGAVVDSMGYGTTATNAFVEGTAETVPPASSSAARTPDKTDTNNNQADFATDATPTPGAANG